MHIQKFTANVAGLVRNDQMEGRDYIVAPVVMMTEGVHAGSDGPILYEGPELEKSAPAWNHKPLVSYHPTMNGENVSAGSPEVATARKVGVVMNARWDGKLRAEAWFEKSRLEAVDPDILQRLTSNQVTEVSTGVFVDLAGEPGVWSPTGEEYIGKGVNHRPDHLAILCNAVGACSVADGAGLLVVNDALGVSFSVIGDGLSSLLYAAYGSIWLCDVYPNYCVYELGNRYYKIPYTVNDGVVKLSGDPVQVRRVYEYRTLDNAVITNQSGYQPRAEKGDLSMDRKKAVDRLVGNKESVWKETDRPFLYGINDDAFAKIVANADSAAAPRPDKDGNITKEGGGKDEQPATGAGAQPVPVKTDVNEPNGVPVSPVDPNAPKPTENQRKPLTVNEYIETAPAELRDSLREMHRRAEQEKAGLIDRITSNQNNAFTKEFLQTKGLDELRGIAALAAQPVAAPTANVFGGPEMFNRPVPLYDGLGPVANNYGGVTANALDAAVPLTVPAWNADEK